jgi:hypothetical protein
MQMLMVYVVHKHVEIVHTPSTTTAPRPWQV